jgi:predicted nucleic acid-binding protein
MSPGSVEIAIERLLDLYEFIEETTAVFLAWREIARNYQLIGKSAHDARLVALMRICKISCLMTLDDDFTRYADVIRLLNPRKLETFPQSQ